MTADESIAGLATLLLKTLLELTGHTLLLIWKLAVWLIGHWFQNTEQNLGGEVMGMRLAGAAMMTVAIVVTLMS